MDESVDSIEIVEKFETEQENENHISEFLQVNQAPQSEHLNKGSGLEETDQGSVFSQQIYNDPEMDNVKVEIVDSKTQYDWLIFEQHMYEINSQLSCDQNNKRVAMRRFSDFEWLFQELLLKYPGYILPSLPEKGIYSKLDPKIPYLKQIKNEFMDSRKEMLLLFLQELLSHRDLKFTKELKQFLVQQDNQFQEEREIMIRQRAEKRQSNPGIVKNIYNYGLGVLNIAVGKANIERRKQSDVDEQFDVYFIYYQSQYNKMNLINECFNKIFESRKKQAENLQSVSEVFKNIKDIQAIYTNLNDIALEVGKKQQQQQNQMIKSIQIPLKQYLEQLKNCLDILENRQKLLDKIYQQEQDFNLFQQDQDKYVIY